MGRKRPDLAERNRRPRPDVAARNRGEGIRLYEDKEWCRSRYFDQMMSFQEMATEAQCGQRTIARWFRQHGLVAGTGPDRRERRGNTLRGERSPQWRGGPEPCRCGRAKSIVAETCMDCRDTSGENNGRWRGDQASYENVHWRVKAQRGRAADYPCVACGGAAAHWAYDHSDPNERRQEGGGPYSLDIFRYQPMCVLCHNRMDTSRRVAA
jgi:hypothetical protein